MRERIDMRKLFFVDREMCGGENLPAEFDLEDFCEVLQGKVSEVEIVADDGFDNRESRSRRRGSPPDRRSTWRILPPLNREAVMEILIDLQVVFPRRVYPSSEAFA